MVTAKTGMNFSQELPPFFLGDTSLKYSGRAFLVEFSLVNLVGFRAPHNAACLILISVSSRLLRLAKKGSVHGAMTAMMRWDDGVILVVEPPMMSVCS